MKRGFGIFASLLVAASAASAQQYQNRFPLEQGNQWTYGKTSQVGKYAPFTVSVDYATSYGVAWVTNLPGLDDGVWLGWSGNTLYAWDATAGSWKTFLRFGATTGTKYTIDLGRPLWTNVQVTLASKSAKHYDGQMDKTFYNCVRFTFVNNNVADAGVGSMTFAATYGLVNWTEESFAGPVNAELMSAVLAGKHVGMVIFNSVDQGHKTQYPSTEQQVLVYNTAADFTAFWAQHKPGTDAPAVDFTKQSVIVVLAGWRPSWGFTVAVQNVRWNYPNNNVIVSVLETVEEGPTPNPMSKPYNIVVTKEKVQSATLKWKTQ